jgi:hypothetical protein
MATGCACMDSTCTKPHGFQCGANATYLMRRNTNGLKIWMCDGCADYAYHSGQYTIVPGAITHTERRRRAKDDGVSYER